ncbi:TrmO family methyltransferase domain-containing protein [Vibrio renipiscarius]|uniref:TsaA-like domain-containing protein n=1 Tax=Vibrio renipiscarius TaxID=1461322 RepID=A0A0C2K8K1_9VIBR|nr:TrmO family methyltransferase [Vibrio renipiscarius]KII76758.1 hypothetical protein OJ16_16110 [Vibrio renipiscarius]KII78363.1 hypothetical protein PL18_14460 [Vibrio renipiscarius]
MSNTLRFIGTITTPYQQLRECPNNIDPQGGPLCEIHVDEQYAAGLQGLNVGDDIMLLYWLRDDGLSTDHDAMNEWTKRQGMSKGTFALRTPHRPNPIGVAVLAIEGMSESTLRVRGLDCLNQTKLVDIKPAILRE